MGQPKVIIVIVVVLIIGGLLFYKKNQASYAPMSINGMTYDFHEVTENHKVKNYMLTPGGISKSETDSFLQIVQMTHQDLTDRHRVMVLAQLKSIFNLKSFSNSKEQYHGIKHGANALALLKGAYIIVYVTGTSLSFSEKEDLFENMLYLPISTFD